MISAVQDPIPFLFMKPKALMRVRGEELIPGEPENERDLKAMIDAPIGDRTKWRPQWPQLKEFEVPIGVGKLTRRGEQITVVSYGRMLLLCNEVADELRAEGLAVCPLYTSYAADGSTRGEVWETSSADIQKHRKNLI